MASAAAGTQSSCGHKPELHKLYCLTSGISFHPLQFYSFSSSWSPLPHRLCVFFLFYDWGLSHSLQAHRRKSVSRLNIDICFLLLVPVLALHILPHMIWCRWPDRTLTSHPPNPHQCVSTGVCTHWVIIIMRAVTTNLNHMLETLCLIKPSTAAALSGQASQTSLLAYCCCEGDKMWVSGQSQPRASHVSENDRFHICYNPFCCCNFTRSHQKYSYHIMLSMFSLGSV